MSMIFYHYPFHDLSDNIAQELFVTNLTNPTPRIGESIMLSLDRYTYEFMVYDVIHDLVSYPVEIHITLHKAKLVDTATNHHATARARQQQNDNTYFRTQP